MDVDGELILHHEQLLLQAAAAREPHRVTLTVPVLEPAPPMYFLTVLSDR